MPSASDMISFGLWLDGSQEFFNLGWAARSLFFRGLKFKVPKTPTWYLTDDLSNLPSWLFLVLLRLLMCWMSWRHFFLYYDQINVLCGQFYCLRNALRNAQLP